MSSTLLTFALLSALTAVSSAIFSYTCHPNDTIIGTNPQPGVLKYAFAKNHGVVCNTTVGAHGVTVEGCEMNNDILLVLTERNPDDKILGGATSTLFLKIRCNEIDPYVTKTAILGFTPSIDPTVEASVTPTFEVEAAIRDDCCFTPRDARVVNTAVVGTALYWTIDMPDAYVARPLQCYVRSGTDAFDSNALQVQLIDNGCSLDKDLVGDFSRATTKPSTYRIYSDFFVFKFYDSDYITIHCTIRICSASDQLPCGYNCSPSGRRRRDADDATSGGVGEAGASATIRVLETATWHSPGGGSHHTGPEAVLIVVGIIVSLATYLQNCPSIMIVTF